MHGYGKTINHSWIIRIPAEVFHGIVYSPRTWCSFCPMGYLQSLLSRERILKISLEGCKNCKKCHSQCQLDICRDYTGTSGTMDHPDCFNCMKCTDSCSFGANIPIISLCREIRKDNLN